MLHLYEKQIFRFVGRRVLVSNMYEKSEITKQTKINLTLAVFQEKQVEMHGFSSG